MFYESVVWFVLEDVMVITRRTEKAIIKVMCGVELIGKRSTQKLINLLGLEETLNRLAV